MAIFLTSNNYSGQTADITFFPQTGGTVNVGTQTIPYTYVRSNDEYYFGTYSLNFTSFNVVCSAIFYELEYIVVGGGASGGSMGAGGGAGGYRSSVLGELSGGGASAEPGLMINTGITYSVTIAGGAAGIGPTGAKGNSGTNSVFGSIIAAGGGGGGGGANGAETPLNNACGGGAAGSAANLSISGGTGIANQGFRGGNNSGASKASGGGGGAGVAGGNAVGTQSGNGGNGVTTMITGSAVTRGGGGGGGNHYTAGVGTGGTGGGSDATPFNSGTISSAPGGINTGGGTGGGSGANNISAGRTGNGGSGVVIIKYPKTYNITVGVGLTSSEITLGDYKIRTFTSGLGNISFS